MDTNRILDLYNELMKLKEIDIYKSQNIENQELLNGKANISYMVQLCISNILKSNNILKNFSLLISINKKASIGKQLRESLKNIKGIFQNDFKSYITKLKIKKEKQIESNNKIIIDNLEHKIHIDIRIQFLEIIFKDNKDNLTKFLKENIFLSEKVFDAEDKIKFMKFIIKNFNNKKDIINELLIKLENNKQSYDIDNILFYEYLILELNAMENLIEYKLKFDKNNRKIVYKITSIKKNISDLKHLKNYINLFYIQSENECINEMSVFLLKLYILNNKINDLLYLNMQYLINNDNLNPVKLYKYIIEEIEKNFLSKTKSHISLCKKRIFRIIVKEDIIFYFFGNTKVSEIYNYLMENFPYYFIFYFKINNEEKALNESDYNKTLNELKSKKIELKIYIKETIKENLIENNKLTEKSNDLLEKWFKKFSKNKEVMNKDDVSQFISKITRKLFGPESIKVYNFFRKAKIDSKENYLLKKDKFVNYFYNTFWENIKYMNYYPDLVKMNKSESLKEIDSLNLRYNIINNLIEINDKKYKIYDILKEKYKKLINNEILDIILFFATNSNIYDTILNNFNNNNNMKFTKRIDEYIDNIYFLIIIESIFEDMNFNEDYKNNLVINSEKYEPFDSEDKNDKKKTFIIDFLKNNYHDLIEYNSILLKKINDNERKEGKEIIIRCCLKGIEILNNIYNSYFNINFEKESEDLKLLKFPKSIIKENGLQNYLQDSEKYKNLINNILIFINSYYLKCDYSNEKNKNLLLLIQNCFELLLSLLYTNNNIFEKICKNNENQTILKSIFLNILNLEQNEKNKDYISKLFFFNQEEVEIQMKFLSYLFDLTFSIFEEKINFESIESNKLFYSFFNKFCSYSLKKNYSGLKSKLLELYEKIFNYIEAKDINEFDNQELLYNNYIRILIKSLDSLKNEKNIMKDIIYNKIKNEKTLFELIMDKFAMQQEEKIKGINEEINTIEKIINENDKKKFVSCDKFMEINTKVVNKKKEEEKKENIFINGMLSYCVWYLSFPDNYESIKNLIFDLNKKNEIDKKNGDYLKILNQKKFNKKEEYVGLKNFGNTCYLNSVIQQLFMIPEFRYSILNIGDKKEKIKNEILDDNNMLHQLQRMFTYLLFSSCGEFIPKDFNLSFQLKKSSEIIMGQQDCQEFYSNFCDQIEEYTKNTDQQFIIKNFFIGTICYMNKCSICGSTKYKFDKFGSLSLEVEGFNHINKSLKKYFSSENIEDYLCGDCYKKVNLQKTTLLSNLPNILVIHLNRIVMDYSENKPLKINSRFAFEKKLNLKDYCIENVINDDNMTKDNKNEIYKKKDEYYEYELKGVIIHKGFADAGHYVSLIKVDNQNNSEEKWYEFDDSRIKQFDFKNFEKECFGGLKENSNEEINKNAYLLFYELSKKKPMKILVNKNEIENGSKIIKNDDERQYDITKLNNNIHEKELTNLFFFDKEENTYFKYIPYHNISKNVPKEYLREVIKDNKELDYLHGRNRIINFKDYLIQIIIELFEKNSLKIINIFNFEIYHKLLGVLFNSIFSCISNDINNDKNTNNIIIILKNIVIPILSNKNKLKEDEKIKLINFINKYLLNHYIIKLVFTNSNIKNIQEQFFYLLQIIIKMNNEESNKHLFEIIYKVINDENNLSIYLYDVLNEFMKIKNNDIININEIFMLLYYKLFKKNVENIQIISKIIEHLICEKKILARGKKILEEIKKTFNDRFLIFLFESSIDILVLFIKELQFKDKKFSNDFNINYIQKLYTYCEKSKIKKDKIKLIKLIYGILEIIDENTKNRIEALLGYPTLIIKKNKDNILPLFGVGIMNNKIDTEIFEYISYNHITKERCILAILLPPSYKQDENILDENDKLDLLYELIELCLGFNKICSGNYFLFRYIYLMQSRSIKYGNLYLEIKELLENANKNNNNKYDLSKLKKNERKCIDLIEYEEDYIMNIINLACKINPLEKNNKYVPRPELPECFKSSTSLLNDNVFKDFYGMISNIIPYEIGKISINLVASNNNLSIIRFEYYTTYFKKKELLDFDDEKKEFNYKYIKRDKDKDDESKNINSENSEILDFSIFNDKKDEKEFIIYIDKTLNENDEKDIIIENKEILKNQVTKNCLISYFILCKSKNTVIKTNIVRADLEKDIENNFYLPDTIYNSIEKGKYCIMFNIHRLRHEFNFLNINCIGTEIKTLNYDKYFDEYIK